MTPYNYPLGPFTAGDHFPGIPSLSLQINGAAPASALASARMRFKPSDRRPDAAVELTSGAGKITISSAANWQMTVPVQAVPGLTAGTWKYNLETTNAAGVVQTFLAGELSVLEDV